MRSIIALLLVAVVGVVYAQDPSIINIIQFSDEYCLCPNQQKLSLVGECLAVLGGYSVYRIDTTATPAVVYIQDCSDSQCTTCVNQTSFNALPPCQKGEGEFYYSVLPEDDPTTYFNAPSILTSRFAEANCADGTVVAEQYEYGLSCFVTAEGSYYYSCEGVGATEYSYVNCTDQACQECEEPVTLPTETCTNDEGVWKSVQCVAGSSTSGTTTSSTDNTATATATQTAATATNGNTNNNVNSASASVSTTTSASSHNVSSSASAAGTAGSATSGGAVHAIFSDVRGGMMRRKAPRANPPYCNGGLPQTTGATSETSVSTAGTAGTAGTATSGGSSGGMKKFGKPILAL